MEPTEADIQELKSEVESLLEMAGGDTGRSARVKSLLLDWWNAEERDGVDLTELSDMEIVEAIQQILFVLANYRFYPERFGYGSGSSAWRESGSRRHNLLKQ